MTFLEYGTIFGTNIMFSTTRKGVQRIFQCIKTLLCINIHSLLSTFISPLSGLNLEISFLNYNIHYNSNLNSKFTRVFCIFGFALISVRFSFYIYIMINHLLTRLSPFRHDDSSESTYFVFWSRINSGKEKGTLKLEQ